MPSFDPGVRVTFDREERVYAPSAPMSIRYSAEGIGTTPIVAVERSVLWYTEGKGEEDIGVHFFDRLAARPAPEQPLEAGSFNVLLPSSPLSYEGVIVKVRWCVRIRFFFDARTAQGERLQMPRDFVSEHVFDLGTIPPAAIAGGAQSA
jgi:hypothetical protein